MNKAQPLIERNQGLSSDERVRFRLAARWYWSVQEETDNVLAFVQWWLIVECLEMVKTTDVRPVRERLAQLLACSEDALRGRLGRLFGLRSRLLHGDDRDVSDESLQAVESVARLFLADRAGTAALKEKDTVRTLFGIS